MKKFFSRPWKASGVSLVETLVVTAIALILSFVLLGVYQSYGNLYGLGRMHFSSVGGARSPMSEFVKYVSQAHRVVASQSFGGTVYTSSSSTLVLQIPAVDVNSRVVANSWDYVVFYKNGTRLYSRIAPSAASTRVAKTTQLTDVAESAVFVYDNSDVSLATKVQSSLITYTREGRVMVTHSTSEEIALKNY